MDLMLLKCLIVMLLLAVSCQTGVKRISGRPIQHIEKPGTPINENGSAANQAPGNSEVYTRERRTLVRPTQTMPTSGSLFDPQNQGNFLIATHLPSQVGDFLMVKVVSNGAKANSNPDAKENRGGKGRAGANSEEGSATGERSGAANSREDKRGKLESELLKELPDLVPSAGQRPVLETDLSMMVTKKFPNGDLQVQFSRRSSSNADKHDLSILARVPYSTYAEGNELTTNDLRDVKIVDVKNSEQLTRESTRWEDEYALRISGFDESKSMGARELMEKQRKLQAVRLKMEKRLQAMEKERREISKLRAQLMESSKDGDKKASAASPVDEKSPQKPNEKPAIPTSKPGNAPAVGGGVKAEEAAESAKNAKGSNQPEISKAAGDQGRDHG